MYFYVHTSLFVENFEIKFYSGSVMIAAAISVPLTLLIACCLACRKCRKRGKGESSSRYQYRGGNFKT
jgi:hypothetical protein